MSENNYKLELFEAIHGLNLTIQTAQQAERLMVGGWSREQWKELEKLGEAWTASRDGRILGCAGMIQIWKGRAGVWAMIGEGVDRSDMLFIHRRIRRFLEEHQPLYRRIETTVLESFQQGHRWAEMLGFRSEGTMRCYDPQGKTHRLYARTR